MCVCVYVYYILLCFLFGFISGAHKRGCIWALLALSNLCVRLLIKGIVSGERRLEKEDQESSFIFVFVLSIELDFGGGSIFSLYFFFFFFFFSFVVELRTGLRSNLDQ